MASPRRAVLRRSGDETAAASAMLNTFFRDARMFSGTIWVQRAAYKIVSNDTTSKRARFVLNVIKRLGSPRGAYRAACMRTSQNSVKAKFTGGAHLPHSPSPNASGSGAGHRTFSKECKH